jgi:imidazolonepropionase-like amidohydrolase
VRRLLALLLVALAGCGGEEPNADLLIRADRLFDGERFVEPGAVLIRGDRIVAAGTEVSGGGERTIDLGDATILPGFVDLHVHVSGPQVLRRGVTTARNLGSSLEFLDVPRPSPQRLLRAGPLVTAPGGYPIPVFGAEIALEVRGQAQARAAVRDLARRGADVIKIALEPGFGWPVLTAAEVGAIVDEAHARELPVVAHATAQFGAELALTQGADELVHYPCGGLLPETRRELVEREIEIVATLHALDVTGACGDPVAAASEFVAAGGRLLYGSDMGVQGIPDGIDVEELRLLRRAGLSPAEVLAAATSLGGEQLGLAPLGRLTADAPADVIAIAGDARRLPRSFELPLLVVRAGGLVVDPDE